MQIKEPLLVIVPEEDYEYGLNSNAYPEYANELRSGNLVVLSKEEASSNYGIVNPEENKIYVRNPYDGIYLDLAADNLDRLFMEKKAIQIREVLIMLGVYSATLESTVEKGSEKDIKINGSYERCGIGREKREGENKEHEKEPIRRNKNHIVSGGGSFNSTSQHFLNLATKIDLKPYRRLAKTPKEIRRYLNSHGLGEESTLKAWVDRYERDGIMIGAESLEVSFLEDLAKVRNGALNLQFLKDEARFNIESQCKQTHIYTKKIFVDFNGPIDCQEV